MKAWEEHGHLKRGVDEFWYAIPDLNKNGYEIGFEKTEKVGKERSQNVICWINHRNGGERMAVEIPMRELLNLLEERGIYG